MSLSVATDRERIYGWTAPSNNRTVMLLSKMKEVGIRANLKPANTKIVDDLLDFYDPSSKKPQWAVFLTNDAMLLTDVEHAVATSFCLTFGLSVNYLTPQIIFDNLRYKENEESVESKNIYSGSFVVMSEVDKTLKPLAYHKGSLSALFKHWITTNTLLLFTSTYRKVHTEKDRTFIDTIEHFYGEIASSVMGQATYFTHHVEEKNFIKFNKIG